MTVLTANEVERLTNRPPKVRPPVLPRERGRQKLLDGVPLLHGEAFDPDLVRCAQLLQQLLAGAAAGPGVRSETLALTRALASGGLETEQVLTEALAGHWDHLSSLATWAGLPGGRLVQLADLAVRPSLAALQQALSGLYREPGLVRGGCCPVCGSWPGLIEERPAHQRHLRCTRCAADWEARSLQCGLCGQEGGLERLSTDRTDGSTADLECCRSCGRYLKVLAGESSADLARLIWVELADPPLGQLAAERGYRAAEGACFRLEPAEAESDESWEDLLEAD